MVKEVDRWEFLWDQGNVEHKLEHGRDERLLRSCSVCLCNGAYPAPGGQSQASAPFDFLSPSVHMFRAMSLEHQQRVAKLLDERVAVTPVFSRHGTIEAAALRVQVCCNCVLGTSFKDKIVVGNDVDKVCQQALLSLERGRRPCGV
eukprot:6120591-Amphidinium_carterae.1